MKLNNNKNYNDTLLDIIINFLSYKKRIRLFNGYNLKKNININIWK